MAAKILFILKHRDCNYSDESYSSGLPLSSGLSNSAQFVVDMLVQSGIDAKLVQVPDNNSIDKEVSLYQPDYVVIEAYWVIPEKFSVLQKLHPKVKWIVRCHSAIPFMSTEGISLDWTLKYLTYDNVFVAANSIDTYNDIKYLAQVTSSGDLSEQVLYLPNYYTFTDPVLANRNSSTDTIDIGVFGAIRPLKNQLIQVIAAIEFAKQRGKKLRVHINATRVETGGDNPLKNIRAIFANLNEDYQLIEHTWIPHYEFLYLVSMMDMILCVSVSETMCIVGVDGISMGVPVVGCADMKFLSPFSIADHRLSSDILEKMNFAWSIRKTGILQKYNKLRLNHNIQKAKKQWLNLLVNGSTTVV